MKKLISFLSGALLGGLVGATFALLFAPSTGKELQEKMLLNAQDLKNEIQLAAKSRRQELQAQLDKLRKP
ncbi:MAG: hypothetical protein C0391_08350 [Anaerolinea sp.]|nr:hypothetical protein [Anaerolinea sp.]